MDGRTIKIDYARSSKKNPPPEPLPTKKYNVYVGNLAWRVRFQDLRELFSASWKVISAEIVYQTNPRRPAGYGFVSFASEDDAKAAISTLNGKVNMNYIFCRFVILVHDLKEYLKLFFVLFLSAAGFYGETATFGV